MEDWLIPMLGALASTSLLAYVFFRKGWHEARIFTDPKVRRWGFLGWTILEISTAISNGDWYYWLFAAWFLMLFVSDTMLYRSDQTQEEPK